MSATHGGRVAEAHLGLGRVDVDVDLVERDVEEQGGDRMAIAGDKVAISGSQRADEQAVLHRPRVHEQELLIGHAAVERRKADDARQAQAIPNAVDADPVTVEFMAQKLRHSRRRLGRLKRQDASAV